MGDMSFFDAFLMHATLLLFAASLLIVSYMVSQRVNYHEDVVDYLVDEEDYSSSHYLMTVIKHENRVYWVLTALSVVLSLGSVVLSLMFLVNS